MKRDDAEQVLERIGMLRSRCDLDLLLFFPGTRPRSSRASSSRTGSAMN
jgi:hypothetical protein